MSPQDSIDDLLRFLAAYLQQEQSQLLPHLFLHSHCVQLQFISRLPFYLLFINSSIIQFENPKNEYARPPSQFY